MDWTPVRETLTDGYCASSFTPIELGQFCWAQVMKAGSSTVICELDCVAESRGSQPVKKYVCFSNGTGPLSEVEMLLEWNGSIVNVSRG